MTLGLNDPQRALESWESLEEETNLESSHTQCVGVALLSPSLYSSLPRLPSFRPKEHKDNNTPPLPFFATHTHTHIYSSQAHHDFSNPKHMQLRILLSEAQHTNSAKHKQYGANKNWRKSAEVTC